MNDSEDGVLQLPQHLGFIIDGNRRWARTHGIPTYEGHLAGYNALKEVVIDAVSRGIPYVSLYAFSTENWKREKGEVSKLMKLTMRIARTDLKELIDSGIRVIFLGIEDGLSDGVVKAMRGAEEKTKHLSKGTALICFNYGGQREIVDAARQCIREGLRPEDITEESFAQRLYHPEVPAVDMIVRTSGEQRLSNFMLWRSAYSEFYFLEKFWPDMTKDDVTDIIEEYTKRNRRFGGN